MIYSNLFDLNSFFFKVLAELFKQGEAEPGFLAEVVAGEFLLVAAELVAVAAEG